MNSGGKKFILSFLDIFPRNFIYFANTETFDFQFYLFWFNKSFENMPHLQIPAKNYMIKKVDMYQ